VVVTGGVSYAPLRRAMIIMALVNLTLLGLSEYKILTFAWSWLVIVGTAGTMALAMLFTGRASTPATEDVGDAEMASQTPGRPE